MRVGTAIAVLVIFGVGFAAEAQDPGAMAAQQATDTAIQANQQAMEVNQQAQQAAMQANQDASQAAQTNIPSGPYRAAAPKFSAPAGSYHAPVTVRMKTRSRSAIIFYTTDGWSPTTASTRYVGPIKIAKTTHLQAITVSPGTMRSEITSAMYTLPAGAKTDSRSGSTMTAFPNPNGDASHVSLLEGMPVRLVFAAPVSSKNAQVGDSIGLTLAHDLRVDGVLVAPKGTAATGTVLLVDKQSILGRPGVLQFRVDQLALPGSSLPLRGFAEMDGVDRQRKAVGLSVIPAGGVFVRGGDAVIPAGMAVTAYVAKDTTMETAKLR
jgi:hypothetical protein